MDILNAHIPTNRPLICTSPTPTFFFPTSITCRGWQAVHSPLRCAQCTDMLLEPTCSMCSSVNRTRPTTSWRKVSYEINSCTWDTAPNQCLPYMPLETTHRRMCAGRMREETRGARFWSELAISKGRMMKRTRLMLSLTTLPMPFNMPWNSMTCTPKVLITITSSVMHKLGGIVQWGLKKIRSSNTLANSGRTGYRETLVLLPRSVEIVTPSAYPLPTKSCSNLQHKSKQRNNFPPFTRT